MLKGSVLPWDRNLGYNKTNIGPELFCAEYQSLTR
jgi:hypothetical protein